MYLALKRKGSMWILDMKIFKPIKGCKNGQILVLYRAIWKIDWLYLIKLVWNVMWFPKDVALFELFRVYIKCNKTRCSSKHSLLICRAQRIERCHCYEKWKIQTSLLKKNQLFATLYP